MKSVEFLQGRTKPSGRENLILSRPNHISERHCVWHSFDCPNMTLHSRTSTEDGATTLFTREAMNLQPDGEALFLACVLFGNRGCMPASFALRILCGSTGS